MKNDAGHMYIAAILLRLVFNLIGWLVLLKNEITDQIGTHIRIPV